MLLLAAESWSGPNVGKTVITHGKMVTLMESADWLKAPERVKSVSRSDIRQT